MELDEIILIFLGIFIFIGFSATCIFTYIEEKRKCKHKWEETDRLRGYNLLNTLVTEVHLKCINCGDVKKVSL